MVITSYHIQNILRTYSQQLSEGTRLARTRKMDRVDRNDLVKISTEARKQYMIEKISQEMVQNLGNGFERNNTAQEILNRLSQEYGQPLDVALQENQGLIFQIKQDSGPVRETLSPADSEQLKTRLMDITKTVVSNNLL
ncbi:MAG: hypothetical protein MUF69_01825 [Desulfobacterota bacterium]|jgi:hypothetical protein|nr:hypothetical protein [Thermodesulfobacteriota bacterium]